MLVAIILISIAFGWLGYETQWFTIRLLVGELPEKDDDDDDYADNKAEHNPNPPITNPVIFTPLDMPELQGAINIGYKRI